MRQSPITSRNQDVRLQWARPGFGFPAESQQGVIQPALLGTAHQTLSFVRSESGLVREGLVYWDWVNDQSDCNGEVQVAVRAVLGRYTTKGTTPQINKQKA